MRESEVHRFLKGEASLLERWKIDRKHLFHYTAQEILELAVKGNVLIRGLALHGRGAVLGLPRCSHKPPT